jgi:hypothetical protein
MTEAAMGFEHILVGRSGDFATVTMNRPQRRNALPLQRMRELRRGSTWSGWACPNRPWIRRPVAVLRTDA